MIKTISLLNQPVLKTAGLNRDTHDPGPATQSWAVLCRHFGADNQRSGSFPPA
jgi:hypothetical protein